MATIWWVREKYGVGEAGDIQGLYLYMGLYYIYYIAREA
jgi:hypothetical protein